MYEQCARLGLFIFDGLVDSWYEHREDWLEQRVATLRRRAKNNEGRGWHRLAQGQRRRANARQDELEALRGGL